MVMVEFNVGVQCHGQGAQLATRLNGQAQTAFTTGPNFCSCSTTAGSKGTVQVNPSHYLVGAQNTFTVTITTSFGFIPRAEWGSGVYGRVTVFYSGDCNANGIPDDCDIASGFSRDVIGASGVPDGVPDECQKDCNGNGIPDEVDIANSTSRDCNRNGVPDECDIAKGTSQDCNRNGIPDECELRTSRVYNVPLADLLNTTTDCGGGSRYGTSGQVGFRWNDVGSGQVSSVKVEFNVGLDCHSVGAAHVVTLNGASTPGFATATIFCSCSSTPGTKVVLQPSPASYTAGGQNSILIGITTSFGFIPRAEFGSGIYARITVEYSGVGGPLDCNGNGIPDSCDIAFGASLDLNGNGIPDECEP